MTYASYTLGSVSNHNVHSRYNYMRCIDSTTAMYVIAREGRDEHIQDKILTVIYRESCELTSSTSDLERVTGHRARIPL